MHTITTRLIPVVFVSTLVVVHCGCAKVRMKPDFEESSRLITRAVGAEAFPIPSEEVDASELLERLLADGITADEAVRLCLFNNPRVRSAFLDIGMARADVVQSGLFRNPSLSLSVRFPDGGGLANVDGELAQNIADLWLIPLRKREAEGELRRRILQVARDVSLIALQTRGAYFRAIAADREHDIARENRDLAEQLFETAGARQEAGVGSQIDVNLAQAVVLEAEMSVRNTTLSSFQSRRELAELLGLDAPPGELRLTDSLPDPKSCAFSENRLVELARTHRVDLTAARSAVVAADARWRKEKRNVFENVELGVSAERFERPPGSDRNLLYETARKSLEAGRLSPPELFGEDDSGEQDVLIGPTLALSLPIFDQNQAQIAKAELSRRQSLLAFEALSLEIIQSTRVANQQVRVASDISGLYRDELLPLLQNNLTLSREAYRVGKASFLSVLESQQELLKNRARYVEALRESTLALVELEKAVGLPVARIVESNASDAAAETAGEDIVEERP